MSHSITVMFNILLQFFVFQTKERPKRKGPLDHLPSSVEEWGLYDAPDEVVDASGHPLMKLAAVNDITISKPVSHFKACMLLYISILRRKQSQHLSVLPSVSDLVTEHARQVGRHGESCWI